MLKELEPSQTRIATGAAAINAKKKVIFKNCTPFANCICQINNTKIDAINSKTLESLREYYIDEPALSNNNNIINFPANKESISCNLFLKNNRANRKQWHKRF